MTGFRFHPAWEVTQKLDQSSLGTPPGHIVAQFANRYDAEATRDRLNHIYGHGAFLLGAL